MKSPGLHAVVALFAILAATGSTSSEEANKQTLVVLLDGFRWDYLSLLGGETGGFSEFLSRGVAAEHVKPIFPSLSFPGWTTISTGVYPETHGILANFFYHRHRQTLFALNNSTLTRKSFWWQNQEPVWTTATRHGLRVATVLWSRSDVPIRGVRPEESQGYEYIPDTLENLRDNLAKSLEYLQRGFHLVMMYAEHLDLIGHQYGPDSLEMKYSVGDVAKLLRGMFNQLDSRNLRDKVNVIVLSDHGMATVDPGDPIPLRNYLDPETDVEHALGQGAFVSIYAKPGRVEYVYSKLAHVTGLKVYKRGEVPANLHYNRNALLPDIIVSANKGYIVRGLNQTDRQRTPAGVHGYHPDVEQMRTIFYALGPDFKQGHKVGALELVDVYQILCHALKIPAMPHNGSWYKVREMFIDEPQRPFGEEEHEEEDDLQVMTTKPTPKLMKTYHVKAPTPIRSTPTSAWEDEVEQQAASKPAQLPPERPADPNSADSVRIALSVVVGVVGWYIWLSVVTN